MQNSPKPPKPPNRPHPPCLTETTTLNRAIFISHGSCLPDLVEAYNAGQLYALAAKDLLVGHAIAACIAATQTACCFGTAQELSFIVIEAVPRDANTHRLRIFQFNADWKNAIHFATLPLDPSAHVGPAGPADSSAPPAPSTPSTPTRH